MDTSDKQEKLCRYCGGDILEPRIIGGEPLPDDICTLACLKYFCRKEKPERYLEHCMVPERYLKCSFENYKAENDEVKKVLSQLKNIERIEDSILLTGPAGCGKTHLSVALMRDQSLKSLRFSWFHKATDILMELRSVYDEEGKSEKEIFKKYLTEDILIIDDIGAEKVSDYVIQSWYKIIDDRYSACLPTAYTTNLKLSEIGSRFGDRIASRLAAGLVLSMKGKDMRMGG